MANPQIALVIAAALFIAATVKDKSLVAAGLVFLTAAFYLGVS